MVDFSFTDRHVKQNSEKMIINQKYSLRHIIPLKEL